MFADVDEFKLCFLSFSSTLRHEAMFVFDVEMLLLECDKEFVFAFDAGVVDVVDDELVEVEVIIVLLYGIIGFFSFEF